jgi:hypothetical protein
MDTVEKVATFGYTRHRMKTNKTTTKNTKQKDEQHGPNPKPGVNLCAPEGNKLLLLTRRTPCYSYIQSSPAVIEERQNLRQK